MNAWQTWLLLRPLVVFALGCPLFVLVALAGLRNKYPNGEVETETRADQGPRFVLSRTGTWRFEDDGQGQSLPSNSVRSLMHAGDVVA